jgi:hypothetical protein
MESATAERFITKDTVAGERRRWSARNLRLTLTFAVLTLGGEPFFVFFTTGVSHKRGGCTRVDRRASPNPLCFRICAIPRKTRPLVNVIDFLQSQATKRRPAESVLVERHLTSLFTSVISAMHLFF